MGAGGLILNKVAYVGAEASDKGGLYWDSLAEIPYFVNDAGRVTARSNNASIAAIGGATGFATDTYVTDSDILIPSFGMQVRSVFNWRMSASKTGASTGTPVYSIRIGSGRAITDTARLALTGPAQTGVADIGTLNIMVVCRAVNASTGVIQGTAWWDHRGTAANTTTSGTGFANDTTGHVEGTSANFDNTAATIKGLYIGVSINGGALSAWTMTQSQTEVDW
jgi:hypothetical protein